MTTLKELLAQREILDVQIKSLHLEKRHQAIAEARNLVAGLELTQADIFGKGKAASKRVFAKYKDPRTHQVWSGRGRPPIWISESGKDKSEFLIES